MTVRERLRFESTDESHRVTSLELLFDLVFVYALTQVTALLAADTTWIGVTRGVVVLCMLWFAWCAYAWLGNQAKADEGVVRAGVVLAMMPLFVAALAIVESFDDIEGGWYGPLTLAVAVVLVRVMHLLVYAVAAGDDRGLQMQLVRTAVPVAVFAGLVIAGSFLDATAQLIVWAVAVTVDYVGIYLGGAEGWRLNAPAHFAERHGLVIIIALGESIVALGVGAADEPVSAPLVTAVVLGLGIAVAMWWAYFDVVAPVAERVLHRAQGAERARLGRDSYTYLHFPMLAGIVFLALGLKKVIGYVADTEHHELTDPLTGIPLLALYGGVALYLLAHVAFRLRNVKSLNRQRAVTVGVLIALVPVAWQLPALASLGLLATVLVALIGYESTVHADARRAIRHAAES
ncbi:MAG: low temperature requirement protein A [Sporichthyaceae bacterium]